MFNILFIQKTLKNLGKFPNIDPATLAGINFYIDVLQRFVVWA